MLRQLGLVLLAYQMNADDSSLQDAKEKLRLPNIDLSPAEEPEFDEMRRYPAVLARKLREVENFVLLLVKRGNGEEDAFEPVFAENLPQIAAFLDVTPVVLRQGVSL